MTGSDEKIESSKLARALEEDQQLQRHEEQAAIRREEELSDRLATELAKRSSGPPGR